MAKTCRCPYCSGMIPKEKEVESPIEKKRRIERRDEGMEEKVKIIPDNNKKKEVNNERTQHIGERDLLKDGIQ